MLTRFLSTTRHRIDTHMKRRKVIKLWNNGTLEFQPSSKRNIWPVAQWTQLLSVDVIKIAPKVQIWDSKHPESIALDPRISNLAHIHDHAFWKVIATKIEAGHRAWKYWLDTAFEYGNVACLNAFPSVLTNSDLQHAYRHSASKHWVENHPTHSQVWNKYWGPLSYVTKIDQYLDSDYEAEELLALIKDNIPFEGVDTVFGAVETMFYRCEHCSQDIRPHVEVLRTMWAFADSSIPFDIMCSSYGLMPVDRENSRYAECQAIANYVLKNNLWRGFEPSESLNISGLHSYLHIAQPSTRVELLNVLLEYYSNQKHTIAHVDWDPSFTEGVSAST